MFLVSRDTGVQPPPNGPASLYTSCSGIVTWRNIHFHCSLLPNDRVYLYMKLLLDAFCTFLATLMPILTDSIAFIINHPKYNKPSEIGIVMVYLCTAERKPQNGVVRLFQKVTCLSTYLFTCPHARLIGGKSWSTLEVFVWEIWGLNYIPVGQFQYIYIYIHSQGFISRGIPFLAFSLRHDWLPLTPILY